MHLGQVYRYVYKRKKQANSTGQFKKPGACIEEKERRNRVKLCEKSEENSQVKFSLFPVALLNFMVRCNNQTY